MVGELGGPSSGRYWYVYEYRIKNVQLNWPEKVVTPIQCCVLTQHQKVLYHHILLLIVVCYWWYYKGDHMAVVLVIVVVFA